MSKINLGKALFVFAAFICGCTNGRTLYDYVTIWYSFVINLIEKFALDNTLLTEAKN